jgi:hypothetical protein
MKNILKKAKTLASKTKSFAKTKIRDKKRDIAYEVLQETRGIATNKKDSILLNEASNLVDRYYEDGGNVNKGAKVKLKNSDDYGVVVGINNNRISVIMSNGTARVFNADEIEMFAQGGGVEKERVYIDFLNKKKNFTKDRKYFDSYAKAKEWAMKNFEKFNSDMIKYEYAKGGRVTEDTENSEMVLNNNKQIKHHTEELPKAIKGKKVPAWVVAKVNRSASDLSDATHYMDGQGEKYKKGGSINNNDSCIDKVIDMVSRIKEIDTFYIADKKLVIIFKEELGVYEMSMFNHHLSELENCSNVVEDEFEMGYGEEYKTIILPLKTSDFTKNKFKKGGSVDKPAVADQSTAIETKNKLKKNFDLPFELAVYVPSTSDANNEISEDEFEERIKIVSTFLSNLFGGFSSNEVSGGYLSSEKGLIEEDVFKVTAFASKDGLDAKMKSLVNQIKEWCKEWSQEAIGLEFEGDLYYLSQDAEYKNGGIMYAQGGGIGHKKPKYKVGQLVYSYQNKDTKYPINYVKEADELGIVRYRLSLPDGNSHWINEESIYTDKYAQGGDIDTTFTYEIGGL